MAIDAQSGRAVAIARRVALSAGKAALPAAVERVRDGLRTASTKVAEVGAPVVMPPVRQAPPAPSRSASSGLSGRAASLERRKMLSAGKGAVGQTPQPPAVAVIAGASSREISIARRAMLAQTSGLVAVKPGVAAPVYSPRPAVVATGDRQLVTSSRIGRGSQVTGDKRATVQQVSGTQNVEVGATDSWRSGGPKVGFAKTAGGITVSGSMVRSAVSVTGDEAGNAAITGRVDQAPRDDLTTRNSRGGVPASQFQRLGPQGAAIGGQPGSRERLRERPAEATESGFAITGSALGGGGRVTGDQSGASRRVSGTHYMAPARLAADKRTPTSAPVLDQAEQVRAVKGGMAQSWGGQTISGLDVEHNKRVTGDAPGNCSALTGSQYQGPTTVGVACETGKAETATQRRMRAKANRAITGNSAQQQSEGVTGIARGAGRDITGTPCAGGGTAPAPANDPVAAQDVGFSIRSPQRTAHLAPARIAANEEKITGSFAAGGGKLTGNLEFQMRSRASEAGRQAASSKVSGEGSTKGTAVTGNTYGNQANVTGVGGAFATERNPSQRGPKAKAIVNVGSNRSEAAGEPRQLVTGLFGSFSKAGARVTLSGGAQT